MKRVILIRSSILKRVTFVAAVLLMGAYFTALSARAEQDGAVRPLSPKQLMALLPGPPDGWKLTQSKGAETLNDTMLVQSQALRAYHYTPPPPAPGQPPQPDQNIQVTLYDTAFDQSLYAPFDAFRATTDPAHPDATAKEEEHFMLVSGYQAVQLKDGPNLTLFIKLSNRFLLYVLMTNVDQKGRDQWLQLANIAGMGDSCSQVPVTRIATGPLTLETINELDAKFNGTRQIMYMTPKDLTKLDDQVKAGLAGPGGHH